MTKTISYLQWHFCHRAWDLSVGLPTLVRK